MPLHLLGKKSWHVYNADNVSRVRQDEADAQTRREAAEQRMQAEDAAYRTAVLRGEDPIKPPALSLAEDEDDGYVKRHGREADHKRPRRRLRGEDDTDREIRFAREDAEAGLKARETLAVSNNTGKEKTKNKASIVDENGHIRLFVDSSEGKVHGHDDKDHRANSEVRKRKREEDVSKMRLSHAAGYNNDSMRNKPWYASNRHAKPGSGEAGETAETKDLVLADVQERDVWGNEDPRRKSREQNRITSSDPFAVMQQAQSQLKRKEVDRERWQKQRAKGLAELNRDGEETRRRDRKHRRHQRATDSLDGFSLDAPEDGGSRDREKHRSRRHRHHSRSRERSEYQRTKS